jgi:hypothetical protein
MPDPAYHHRENEKPGSDQGHRDNGLGEEIDHPGLETIGQAARIGTLGKRIDRPRELLAGEIDLLLDGVWIAVRHLSVLPVPH